METRRQFLWNAILMLAVALVSFSSYAKDVYLLIGQSNMAGRGNLADDAPISAERIEKLDKTDRWAVATEPLHFDKPSAGAGLGMSFARVMADHDRAVTIGLVPCAVGGSALNEWMPGARLYVEAMRRAKIAQKDGAIKAILWHQGESDADRGKLEASYNERLAKMVNAMRRELGLDAKRVPFVFGSIGEFMHAPYYEGNCSLNKVMRNAVDLIPNSTWVEAGDLTCCSDMIHFNTRSVRTLGERYAAAVLRLTKREPVLLRNVYSDHMMFPAGRPIVLAGRTAPKATVRIAMGDAKMTAQADKDGAFRAELPARKLGGPYEVSVVSADDSVTLKDVMVGDVKVVVGDDAEARKTALRILEVPQELAPMGPNENLPGCAGWRVANTEGATGLIVIKSAIKDELPWMSEESLHAAGHKESLEELAYVRAYRPVVDGRYQVPKTLQRKADVLKKWISAVEQAGGETSAEARANWMKVNIDEKEWKPAVLKIEKPSFVWYRWHVEIPADCKELRFFCNGITDTDEAWFDGQRIGETGIETKYHWGARRDYAIASPKKGSHVLAVRVQNHFGIGGMKAPKLVWKGGEIDLAKERGLMRVETMPNEKTGPRPPSPWGSDFILANPAADPKVPTTLYNALIAPLEVFAFEKGAKQTGNGGGRNE